MSTEDKEKSAKVEASQSETRSEIETLKRKMDDMNAMAVTKSEVKRMSNSRRA